MLILLRLFDGEIIFDMELFINYFYMGFVIWILKGDLIFMVI